MHMFSQLDIFIIMCMYCSGLKRFLTCFGYVFTCNSGEFKAYS